jgi:hypothetical protein
MWALIQAEISHFSLGFIVMELLGVAQRVASPVVDFAIYFFTNNAKNVQCRAKNGVLHNSPQIPTLAFQICLRETG